MKKKVTINEIALLSGVSPATVARAIGDYGSVSEATKEKVLKTANELNYFPNAIARGMRSNKTQTIAIVVGSIKNSFFSRIIHVVEKTVSKKNYNVIICDTHENRELEINHLKNLYERRVDGIILAPAYTMNQKVVQKNMYLYANDTPLVFIDRELKGVPNDIICTNNYECAYDITKYLLKLGHKKIGVLSPSNYITVFERLKGYRSALEEYGIEFDKNLVNYTEYNNKLVSKKAMGDLLDKNPAMSAVVMLNNTISNGALLELKEREISFPDDISVIVWDDEFANELLEITTVEQPVEEIGRLAAERLLYLIDHKEQEKTQQIKILNNKLKIRKSCKNILEHGL